PAVARHGPRGDVLGALAVVVASLSYAVNALYQRRKMRRVSIFEVSLGQLGAGVLFAIPLAAPSLPSIHFHWVSMAAVIGLGAIGTGVAYTLYYYVMNTLRAVRAAGVTYPVPVTAAFWSAFLLNAAVSGSLGARRAAILTA